MRPMTNVCGKEEEVMRKAFIVSLIVLFTAFAAVCPAEYGYIKGPPELSATLSGADIVPPLKTNASGKAAFTLNKEQTLLFYTITVSNIENVTAAHIHIGKKGQDGPPIAFIKITANKKGRVNGVLAEGSIGAQDLMTSFKGRSIQDLYQEMINGGTYVNVHTEKYPDGEIRGQIK